MARTKQTARLSTGGKARPYAHTHPLPTGPRVNHSSSTARRPKKTHLESKIDGKQAYVRVLWQRHEAWDGVGDRDATVEATMDKIEKVENEIDQLYDEIFEAEEAKQCVVS